MDEYFKAIRALFPEPIITGSNQTTVWSFRPLPALNAATLDDLLVVRDMAQRYSIPLTTPWVVPYGVWLKLHTPRRRRIVGMLNRI